MLVEAAAQCETLKVQLRDTRRREREQAEASGALQSVTEEDAPVGGGHPAAPPRAYVYQTKSAAIARSRCPSASRLKTEEEEEEEGSVSR